MINFIAGEAGIKTTAFIGILFAFAATCLVMGKGMGMLPRDQGREYAVDGKSLPVNREEPDFYLSWFLLRQPCFSDKWDVR